MFIYINMADPPGPTTPTQMCILKHSFFYTQFSSPNSQDS
jgi:hypothetical protein